MVTVQRAFLVNVGAYEALLQLPEQVPDSYTSLPQYVHSPAGATIHLRYIYCTPASAIPCTAPFICTALHLAKCTSVDVNALSKVR